MSPMEMLDWPNPMYLDAVEYMDLVNEVEERHREEMASKTQVDD